MAQFSTSGLEGLILSLEELAELPDSVMGDMLAAQGQVIKTAQTRKSQELGLVDTGQLAGSITVNLKVKKKGDQRFITVYPKGVRAHKKGQKPVRNAEVGFIQEFGAPQRHIAPRQWMRLANEGAADAAVSAAEQVYDKWLKSKGL